MTTNRKPMIFVSSDLMARLIKDESKASEFEREFGDVIIGLYEVKEDGIAYELPRLPPFEYPKLYLGGARFVKRYI